MNQFSKCMNYSRLNGSILLLALSAISLSSCRSHSNELIGGQKDKHGCLIAAGYTWSQLRKDCIRVFTEGIRLNNVKDENATTSAFIVFDPNNKDENAELFLPNSKKGSILLKKVEDEWENKEFRLTKKENIFILYQNGTEIYASGK